MAPTVILEHTEQKESRNLSNKKPVMMIGKTLSRGGCSTSTVLDQNNIEIDGKSEGFVSSCRADTDMAASEGSCGPKRKRMTLNVDLCNSFDVPSEVVSLSSMSRAERKEFASRLRLELERVLVFQKRIVSVGAVSSSGEVRDISDGQKKLVTEKFQVLADLASKQGRKEEHVMQKAPNLKRGLSDPFESSKQAVPCSKKDTMLMKQCETLLKRLMSHQFGWLFNKPVDPVEMELPDYLSVIKNPMDLGTIKRKIAKRAYPSPLDFAADVRLTFSNAMAYNPPGNYAYDMAVAVSKFFEVRWKSIEKKLPVVAGSQLVHANFGIPRGAVVADQPTESKKRKEPLSMDQNIKMETDLKKAKTEADKLSISRDIEALQGEIPESIVDILSEHRCDENESNEEEMEVDFGAMNDETLCTLRKLLDDHLQEKQKLLNESCSCAQLLNESRLSDSSVHRYKDEEVVDEFVDICGDDPPSLTCPPAEITKDTEFTRIKQNTPSSTSGDSEIGLSDLIVKTKNANLLKYSHGVNSSGSELHDAKISLVKPAKESEGSGAILDQEKSDVLDPHDGEKATSGRHVSPEKQYRAALLRSRFADTILKAREKTLIQGEKGDPEKLRREREELEKQRKEEKARLQAEAKALEDARRRANAEAAAEAKRKRELEREAARQALQKMERTVEINENCQFLKDLEILGSAPIDLPSCVPDEMGSHQSLDLMGSFKLSGNNPLEQLGLYMKVDDDEEEEEPVTVPCNGDEEEERD
ncbi:hypothetical protein ACLOJK_012047 [Asimina triloba]